MWAARAILETRRAYRTWFGTLTVSPQVHYVHLARARQRLGAQGIDYDCLSHGEQFAELQTHSGREVTLMLKRIRKATKAPFVYLCVAEAHKSGLPHYHVLIHERDDTQPIRKATLDAEWRIGFSQWRLVRDAKTATYLCKYLGKSSSVRVRASLDYGREYELVHSESVIGTTGSPAAPGAAGTGGPKTLFVDQRSEAPLVGAEDLGFKEALAWEKENGWHPVSSNKPA